MTVIAVSARALNFPNVESVVAGFLQGRSDLSGVPVGSLLPAGFDGTQRAVVLTRLGGVFNDDDQLDNAEVRIDSYGPDKVAAHGLACTVRGVLPLVIDAGLSFSDVTEIQGPCFSIDRRHSDSNRYIMKYRFVLDVKSRPA